MPPLYSCSTSPFLQTATVYPSRLYSPLSKTVSGESAGVEKGGKLLIILHALTIKGKPEDMPDHLVVDVTALEIGHSIHVKEIPMTAYAGLQIMDNPDAPVITVLASKTAEAPVEAAATTAS